MSKSSKTIPPRWPSGNDEGGKLVNRLPTKQMPPTPKEPVRQRYKMAGGC